MKKAILVLGMHRSGTSALTAGMAALGCDVINNVPPNDENPKGFFEHKEIQFLNEEILKTFNTFWGNPCYIPDLSKIYSRSKEFKELYEKAEKILEVYKDSDMFVIKDPRLSLLYPFWENTIKKVFNAQIFHLIMIRNPIEVIDSLLKRNLAHPHLSLGGKKENILRVWLLYNYLLLKNINNDNNYLVSFDQFLNSPKEILKDIEKTFLLKDINEERLNKFSKDFLDKKLKHFNKELTKKMVMDISPELTWSYNLYFDLNRCSAKKLAKENVLLLINKYKKEFVKTFTESEKYGQLLGFYYNQLQDSIDNITILNSEIEQNKKFISKRDEQIKRLNNELRSVKKGLNSAESVINDLRKQNEVLQKAVSELTEQNKQNEALEKALSEIEELNRQNNELQKAVSELTEQNKQNEALEKALSEIEELNRQNNELQKAVSELTEQNKQNEALEKALLEIEELNRQNNELQKAVSELAEQNKQNEALEKALLEINQLTEQNKVLEKRIHSIVSSTIWKITRPIKILKEYCHYKKVYRTIKNSKLFDRDFYLKNNIDIKQADIDPLEHFIKYGANEERNPNAEFDVNYYLNNNPDVRESKINPLYHYIVHDLSEKRKPNQNADMSKELMKRYKPTSIWNIKGQIRNVWAAYKIYKVKKFNVPWYFNMYPDVYKAWQESFWWKYRKSKMLIVRLIAKAMVHPIRHYVWHGVFEGKNPSPSFDTSFYLYENRDVFDSRMNPFYHYCYFGQVEGRKPKKATSINSDNNKKIGISELSIGNIDTPFLSCYQIPNSTVSSRPFVSVIVPNYNHSEFLRQRLDSIYNQTYQHFEVILMDDCSQDDSRDILEEYYNRYTEKTRLLFNENNSGGVFFQWGKGLSQASGDLVWIAESDDWCSHNFLEELTKFFNDEAVMLAYCRSVFIESETNKQIWTIEEYLSDIDEDLWMSPFVCTSHQIMNKAWAIKNIVPNVSSAVFRNPEKMDLLDDPSWKQMRTCGDWVFYTYIAHGGLVAYTTEATNYYRIHKKNTSVASYSNDIFYREHEIVAQNINKLYNVSENVFQQMMENIKQHWLQTRSDFSEEDFSKCFSLDRVQKFSKQRKPNLLMAGYAFAAGGGETFPITLANLLKANGYGVTFLSFEQEDREDGVRRMLRRDIPVVSNFYELNKIVKDMGIEIVHSHHAWVDNTIIDLLSSELCCQHVVSLHGMYETIKKKDLKRILPRLLSHTSQLVYTADKNLEPFKTLGLFNEEDFVKIGNALSYVPINPVNLQELGIPEEAFVLCLVSRAIPEKGWFEAVETIKEARKISGKEIHLIMIGEGPEYDRLKDSSPKYIHFMGFRKNIRDYFAAADLGYLPSRFPGESFPLVIIDCLQSGRPVLASDLGEIPYMLEVEKGFAGSIFSLENGKIPIHKVAEIITRYATDKSFYDKSIQAVNEAAEKFKPEVLFQNYDKVYMEIFKNH